MSKKKLADLKNVGKATLTDFQVLGIDSVEVLAQQDPTQLFYELERRTRSRQDPCVWDLFAAVIHEAKTGEATSWWSWTSHRKSLQKSGELDHVV